MTGRPCAHRYRNGRICGRPKGAVDHMDRSRPRLLPHRIRRPVVPHTYVPAPKGEEWRARIPCESCGRSFVPESESQGELCARCHEEAAAW